MTTGKRWQLGKSGWAMAVAAALLVGCLFGAVDRAAALTIVTGAEASSSEPLLIDPTPDGTDPTTAQMSSGATNVAFISKMPRTMTVDRVTLGEFAKSCSAAQSLQLYVREGTDGTLDNNVQISYSANLAALSTTFGPATFTLYRPISFVAGRSYLFRVSSSGCTTPYSLRTWQHNAPVVDGGDVGCTVSTNRTAKRQWHVQGYADSIRACVTYPDGDTFDPSMPTGWLLSDNYPAGDAIVHGTPNPNAPETDICWSKGVNYNLYGGIPLSWIPNTVSRAFVCAWRQYGPKGVNFPDGWYYGMPWNTDRNGRPRDVLVQLSPPAPYWNLATMFEPVLRFDTSEQQRPLNVDAFFSELLHQVCDGSGESCSSISKQEDLGESALPDSYIDIDGRITDDGSAVEYRSPWGDCLANYLHDCDTGYRSAIYYRVTGPYYGSGSTGYRYIDYWFFYRVNDFAAQINQHEGDWEGVTIAPAGGNTTNPATFDYAALSQHGTFAAYLRDNLACEDTPSSSVPAPGSCGTEAAKVGKRLAVMPSHGGHSNYPRACSEQFFLVSCSGTFSEQNRERGYDGTRRWGRAFDDPTTSLLPLPPDDGSPTGLNWLNWMGHWGKADDGFHDPSSRPTTAPISPLFQSIRIACAQIDNTGGCPNPGPRAAAAAGPSRRRWTVPSPGLVALRCDAWAQTGVSAALCDPAELAAAVRAGDVGRGGGPALQLPGGRRGHSGRGITQVMGRPLNPGEDVTVGADVRGSARLVLRILDRQRHRVLAATYDVGQAVRRGKARTSAARHRLRVRVRHERGRDVPYLGGLRPTKLRRG
jgi:hypothetical protein